MYIGTDQYNNKYYIKKYPRKELLEALSATHADKMYIGNGIHIGYVIKGLWIEVYKLHVFNKGA